MRPLSIPKVLNKPYVLALLVGLVVVIVVGIYYFNTTKEGFFAYPVNAERIGLEEIGKRRYNEYADTQDIEKVGIIPSGAAGDPILQNLLGTPSYAPTKDAKNLSSPNYDDELQYKTPPENTILLARVKKCQSIKNWDCSALNDPEFNKFCGICTSNGQDHLGNPHIGGLYLDPETRAQVTEDANANGTDPKFGPTIGICRGEFVTTRPMCDIQKDRSEIAQAQNFSSPAAIEKGAYCVNSTGNTFVYIGNRGGQSTNYALTAKPVKFTARLRFAVTHPSEATIRVVRTAGGAELPGAFIPNTNTYIVDIPDALENEQYTINVRYPEFAPHHWTPEQTRRIEALVSPKQASLIRAMYGPVTNDFTKDDPRAADVTQYIKDKFRITDCSKTNVAVSNDGLGGDPTPGIFKQARLVYSDNGVDFAYAMGNEGSTTQAQRTPSFPTLCPPATPVIDAQKAVCEINNDQSPSGHIFTQGRNQNYPGAGGAWCVKEAPKMDRGIVGLWESVGSAPRTVPLDLSVVRINGFNVGEEGPPKFGTVRNSRTFARVVPASRVMGIPDYLFWFWARDPKLAVCEFTVVVPATFRDTTLQSDSALCPTGPIVSTPEAAARLQAGACQKPVNGSPQGPGTYTIDCIKSLFLASGCQREGKAFPNSNEKYIASTVDSVSQSKLDVDTIIENMNERYTIATTGRNSNGQRMEQESYGQANMDCFGKFVTNPCDTAFAETGPHTPDCLDYLFRNSGKSNPQIGSTYVGQFNRSSGTDRTPQTPIMYCQRAGSMAPIGADGKANFDAISTANSYGSVQAVRDFYRQIHFDANYNGETTAQKIALNQCYGVGVMSKAPVCKGTKARFVRIRPTLDFGDNWIQISQLQVFNIFDVNVSLKKPTRATSTWANGADGATSDKAVDGQARNRPHPGEFHAGSTNSANTFWQVDLGKTEEIAYIVYFNRADCCQHRARGMRVQLLDENEVVIKERKLTGAMVDTVMFSNAKPSALLRVDTELQFVPGRYSGAAMVVMPGGETLVRTKVDSTPFKQSAAFVAVQGNSGIPGTFSFKHKFSNAFLRTQGFRIRVAPDDGTVAFKNESTFKVTESVSGSPGEVSYESVSSPGSYLAVAENMGLYISPASSINQQKLSSWRLVLSSV